MTHAVHGRRVLVTGVSGFLGSQVAAALLDGGARVRGTARTPPPAFTGTIDIVHADLVRAEDWRGAVDACDVVVHTASPYALDVTDAQRDLVDPAVNGTLNVLRACAAAPTVTRVVLTSSMAAITDEPPRAHTLTEDDWNTASTLTRNPYYLSKTLAERAAWEFMARERPHFSLVVINPFLVIGPSLVPTLNVSNQIFVDLLKGVYPGIIGLGWGVVDVRDAADAHVRAMTTPTASGRYICAGDVMSMRDVVTFLRANGWAAGHKLPSVPLPAVIVKLASFLQKPGVGQYLRTHVGRVPRYCNVKIRRELEMTFRPWQTSVADTMADLVKWGHI